ncbi:MAG TPA: nucleotide disphospho-sugar-binding domain-containing protein [Planctomycetota bacterium]|nr:nucleotide disphospho-sugar-binding domain-containing protein [Planctomycetota bacterium]
MHAILATTGTDGDVYPYTALGTRLRSRGHRVTLAANEHYRAMASELGLGFSTLVTNEETGAFLRDPDVWHPLKCGLAGARWGLGLMPRQYELLVGLAADEDAVLVVNPGILAARLVQEKLSTPLVTLLLQPWGIPSLSAPPVFSGGLTLPRWAPRPIGKLYWNGVSAVFDLVVGRQLNRLRATLGLPPLRRIFEWWLSPRLVIGMFPAWYGPPQGDWPAQVRLAGFPLDDGRPEKEIPREVEDFCRAGPPPIAFTLGTGMMHGARFFRAALEACRMLGARGVLLTKYRQQLPATLPPDVLICEFAPFLKLFPRCAAVVHHGGVGTVAKALAAGTPQLLLPLAWDQPDNAVRVKRLGAGDWLRRGQRSGPRMARALHALAIPERQARCREVALQLRGEDALEVAARWIEEMV